MTNYIDGSRQIYNHYKPESFGQKLKNEWTTQENEISQAAEDDPTQHLALPFGLHIPLAAGLGYGAYKLLNARKNSITNREFQRALEYEGAGDREALQAYKTISKPPSGLSRDEWGAQQVAQGNIKQETLDRLHGIGGRANDVLDIQNRMLNTDTGKVYNKVIKRMNPEELKLFSELGGKDPVTSMMVAQRSGDLRRQMATMPKGAPELKALQGQATAADQLLVRLNNAQRAGIKAPVISGALQDIGGMEGLTRVRKLESAGMLPGFKKPGFFGRLFGRR